MTNPLEPRSAVIDNIINETYDTKTFHFEFTDSRRRNFEFSAGQFVMLSIPGFGEAAISIASDVEEPSGVLLTVRGVGDVTNALLRMDNGEVVGIRGPYGNSWPLDEFSGKRILTISGGCGCGTLRPTILSHVNHPGRFRFMEILHGTRTPGDIIYRNDYEQTWTNADNTKVRLAVERVPAGQSWSHTLGVVTVLFDEMNTTPSESCVLICGPEIMMKFCVIGLLERGFEPEQIFCSMERRMRCGVGLCGHCQLGGKYVCKDGPIFSYAELKGLPDHIIGG